ncbi:trigger factor [Spiroplasma sp. DGKH1]|uniref:trigger factor n=1 Tax=Spiroplasma sp. DGKH1 TaxID=3050074 RepID=UPI0034C63977
MKFKAEKNLDKGIGKWIVTVDGNEWAEVVKKAEQKATNEIEVPGFRKGKVPADLVKKHLTEANILNAAHRLVVNKAYQFAFAQKSDVEPFNSPTPAVKKLSKTEYVLELEFDLKPEIKINKYTGFNELKKEKVVVKKEDIDRSIDQLRDKFAIFKAKTTPIAKGDTVIFDFEGFMDGKPFKGGKASDFTLEIGSGQFIPGFEEAMIGLKTGDHHDINVTFPADYQVEELKGKPAVFKLNIKEVKEKELPELNDELAKDVNLKGIDTLAKLKEHVENNLQEQLMKQEQDRFIGLLFREIAKDSALSIPESIIRKEANQLKHEFEQKLQAQQMDIKTYKKRTGLTEEDINNELFKDAKNRLENGVIVDAVKAEQKFDVSAEDIDKEYDKLGKQFGIDGKTLKEAKLVTEDQIKDQVIHDKVFEYLYNNNGQ